MSEREHVVTRAPMTEAELAAALLADGWVADPNAGVLMTYFKDNLAVFDLMEHESAPAWGEKTHVQFTVGYLNRDDFEDFKNRWQVWEEEERDFMLGHPTGYDDEKGA